MILFDSHHRWSSLAVFSVLLLGFFASAEKGAAQEKEGQEQEGAKDISTEPIQLDDLPSPPAAIAELIEKGSVTFCTGRIPWNEMREARDRTGVAGTRFRLAAETRAEFNYDYKSRTRWRQRRERDKTIVSITVGFSSAKLNVVHRIWFRHPPAADDFWQDSIVQHEFDHVRLSSHPMLDKIFAKNLKSASRFRHELPGDQRVDEALVNDLVREKVKDAFDEISELVHIRYRELDRITRHGLGAVPAESELEKWLDPEVENPEVDDSQKQTDSPDTTEK